MNRDQQTSGNQQMLDWVRRHNARQVHKAGQAGKTPSRNNNGPATKAVETNRDKEQEVTFMFGYQKVIVADNQRALVWRNGRFTALLGPGVHQIKTWFEQVHVEVLALTYEPVKHDQLDYMLSNQPELAETEFLPIAVGAEQVGLVYRGAKLQTVLGPTSQAVYWRNAPELRVELVDISTDFAVQKSVAQQLVRNGASLFWAEVPAQHIGLLFVDGELTRQLPAGGYGYWKFGRQLQVQTVDLRVQALEVSGQELLTQDKVSLRLNLTAAFRVTDAVQALTNLPAYKDFLYRELQFGLRQAVGQRSLDSLLTGKDELNTQVFDYVRERAAAFGIEVQNVGVKDIILPGDMKEILNQVVQAEKAAQANVVRRREEANATRSLLNTAKLMDDNPTLLRLKELEALEKITDNIGELTVFGGLDGVMNRLVKLGGQDAPGLNS